jgi:hypothetical protein
MRPALTLTLLAAAVIAAVTLLLAQRPRFESVWDQGGITDLALELEAPAIRSLTVSPDMEVPGRLSVGDSARTPLDVAVRIKGQMGSKRGIGDKPALKVSVLDGARALGVENLTLNNMVQDPTMLHEAMGYQVYADAGVAVPRTAYVRLAINGQPRGLYLLVETTDRQFLTDRFGEAGGVLYEGAYGTDLRTADVEKFERDEGHDPDRAELTRLIRAVAEPGDAVFFGDAPLVDTESFLAMMAVQVMIGDWDNYYKANNYRIFWHPAQRRWFFIPTGIDQTFSAENPVTPFGGRGVLFRKCLESERCTAAYVAAVRAAAERFEQLHLPEKMDSLLAMIDEASQADPKKPYTASQMRAARSSMRRFIIDRPSVIRASIEAREDVPASGA